MMTSSAPVLTRRSTCRVCGQDCLHPVLSLGRTPLANSFLRSPHEFADEPRFPLDVYFCESCTHLQLLDVVAPAALFRNYIYVSGTSDTIAAHNAEYSHTVCDLIGPATVGLVVEIASNDGSLLTCFKARGARVLGVEPATSIADTARHNGIETVDEFFDSTLAATLREAHGPARAVIANNVLAHVDDPIDFLRGCRRLLAEDGVLVIEVPHLLRLVEQSEYDTIYHEHLSYFSLYSLQRAFAAARLALVRVDEVPIHGGSLRLFARPDDPGGQADGSLEPILEAERRADLTKLSRYQQFATDVARARTALVALLEELAAAGKTVAGYGAPAKGNTLMSYCAIDTRLVAYTVDKNLRKVGCFTPGSHLPVLAADTLLQRQPDYTLIFAWNFADEIIRQQNQYQARGGKFILPLPQPRIV